MMFHLTFIAILLVAAGLVVGEPARAPASEPPAIELTPLPLPANPNATCNADSMMSVTQNNLHCSEKLIHGDDLTPECCTTFSDYFGPTSTLPTANCFCVEAYWTHLEELAEVNYISWGYNFDHCTELGFPIHYFSVDGGPCAGNKTVAEEEASDSDAVLPMRSFSSWIDDLNKDAWGAASFTAAIISVIGAGAMAWSFAFDAYHDLAGNVCPVLYNQKAAT